MFVGKTVFVCADGVGAMVWAGVRAVFTAVHNHAVAATYPRAAPLDWWQHLTGRHGSQSQQSIRTVSPSHSPHLLHDAKQCTPAWSGLLLAATVTKAN